MNDVDAAYREALKAALAGVRDPANGSPTINLARLERAIVANARELHRLDALEKARRECYDRDPKYRVHGNQPGAAPTDLAVPDRLEGTPGNGEAAISALS